MQIADQHDNIVSGATAQQAEKLDRLVLGLAGFRAPAAEAADAFPSEAPDMAMAHILRATLYLMAAEAGAVPELQRSLDAAKALAGTTDRERLHMRALDLWVRQDFSGAAAAYSDLTARYPCDLLGLQVGQQTAFFTGRQQELRDGIARALPAWSHDMPGHGHILGMLAFGLEECGSYEAAEDAGRRAVELDPTDSWAVHAVAHCHEMEGRTAGGIAWLADSAGEWAPDNLLAYHNWWHLALFHLEQGAFGPVLDIYDTHIARAPGAPALELVDGSALLWRLWLRGADVRDRFIPLADAWDATLSASPGPGYLAFNDLHAAVANVGSGRMAKAESHLEQLERAASGCSRHADVVAGAGLPLVRAIYALGGDDPAGAVDLLDRHGAGAIALGGSNAQRDLVALTLLAAAERAGDSPLAERLARDRLAAKPASPFARAVLDRVQAMDVAA